MFGDFYKVTCISISFVFLVYAYLKTNLHTQTELSLS